MDCSMPGLPVPHYLLEFAQVHVHWIGDGIQPCHTLTLHIITLSLVKSPIPLVFLKFLRSWFGSFITLLGISSTFGLFYFILTMLCNILVPWLGIEPITLAVGAQSPNHWTARQFPTFGLMSYIQHYSFIHELYWVKHLMVLCIL